MNLPLNKKTIFLKAAAGRSVFTAWKVDGYAIETTADSIDIPVKAIWYEYSFGREYYYTDSLEAVLKSLRDFLS